MVASTCQLHLYQEIYRSSRQLPFFGWCWSECDVTWIFAMAAIVCWQSEADCAESSWQPLTYEIIPIEHHSIRSCWRYNILAWVATGYLIIEEPLFKPLMTELTCGCRVAYIYMYVYASHWLGTYTEWSLKVAEVSPSIKIGTECVKYTWLGCPARPSRWVLCISMQWLRLKGCHVACDECASGEICSHQHMWVTDLSYGQLRVARH